MAGLISCIMTTSMLLMSLLIVGSAVDYGNNQKKEDSSSEPEYEVPAANSQEGSSEGRPSYINDEAPKPKQHNAETNVEYHYNPNTHDNVFIGIQGRIMCKSAQKPFPLVGAVVRIACLSEYENGYEGAPFYIESHKSDEKGFFFAIFSIPEAIDLSGNVKLKECKVFLEDSPMESCEVPTDINNGITGAILSSPHAIPEKRMTLYTVGPFFYTSDPNYSAPVNYGSVPNTGDHY